MKMASGGSSVVEQLAFQLGEGGSIPTSPLQSFIVQECGIERVAAFIEAHHYSQNVNGIISTFCFRMLADGELIGGMIYGPLAMRNAWRRYGSQESDVIELRRLCCINETPPNTESRFIGYTLRWLRKHTQIKTVISYADPYHGHSGIIYQATNFRLVGHSAKGRVIVWNGKSYHDHAIRTEYKDKLKPFALRLKKALDVGEAAYVETPGKYIYRYDLH